MKVDTRKFFEAAGMDLSNPKVNALLEEYQPHDWKKEDEARAAHKEKGPSKEELKAKVEKHFGTPLNGPHTSEQFKGQKIFCFKDDEGRFFNIAVPADEKSSWDGNMYYVQRKQRDSNGERWVSVQQVDASHDEKNLKIEPTYRLPQGGKELITAFFKSIGYWDN